VTGGGTHLGKAMAEALAAQGARTYIAGRRTEIVEEAASAMRDAGLNCSALRLDITDPIQVDEARAGIAGESGPIDIMVCNAGTSAETAYPPDTDIDAFSATITSHVTGTVITANAAARQMVPRGSGSIITVSSIHGFLAADPRLYAGLTRMPRRSSLAYQTAKAAILGVTRNLAAELGRSGIRVNCISPGHIPKDTLDPELVTRVVEGNALGIVGQPDDMKGAVLLLASDAGRFITGHNLVVDAGWSIW
jgi:NAD(P)-dependent dehydrogenase (short-subunit alcohol dehydrogenase family)